MITSGIKAKEVEKAAGAKEQCGVYDRHCITEHS
jgi:hypothetical protein